MFSCRLYFNFQISSCPVLSMNFNFIDTHWKLSLFAFILKLYQFIISVLLWKKASEFCFRRKMTLFYLYEKHKHFKLYPLLLAPKQIGYQWICVKGIAWPDGAVHKLTRMVVVTVSTCCTKQTIAVPLHSHHCRAREKSRAQQFLSTADCQGRQCASWPIETPAATLHTF